MGTTYNIAMSGGTKVDGHMIQYGALPSTREYVWLDQQVINIEQIKIHVVRLSSIMPDHVCEGR